jgi:heme/copper-type cytochrome/quinol oxidase subunit 2
MLNKFQTVLCASVIGLTLANIPVDLDTSSVSSADYLKQQQLATNNRSASDNNLWFILSIMFMILFFVAFITCVFLWILRVKTIKAMRQELTKKQVQKHPGNVWYGGNYI